jgi:hypothetical protein
MQEAIPITRLCLAAEQLLSEVIRHAFRWVIHCCVLLAMQSSGVLVAYSRQD